MLRNVRLTLAILSAAVLLGCAFWTGATVAGDFAGLHCSTSGDPCTSDYECSADEVCTP